jgi:TRAP-type C4-dicarboxylate transport system substrate-binding protein
MIANGEAWNSLPPDVQNVVTRNAANYTLLQRQDQAKAESVLVKKLQGEGLTFNTPDLAQFRARLAPFYRSQKEQLGATAWGLLEAKVGPLG